MDKNQEKDMGITAKKDKDMAEWYEQVCLKAELAEFSDVKGCMVVRPNGYSIWEAIQNNFNKTIKKHGVRNAAFPLLIPEHYFHLEAEHAEGFSPEVAWVTEAGSSKIEEKLAVRPTSETIISKSFKNWLRSYRDLPIKVNQWCSVIRWETQQTKLFLRSREFWWQEGHCLYETEKECVEDTKYYLDEYKKVCEDLLAIPVLSGVKTEKEKFAGAEDTYAIEALMPDGKALQMGTSHYLGTGFMKAFGVKFIGRDEKKEIPHYNSWGISTRMIGGLVMTHSDDKGLVLPPKIADVQAVIVPIIFEKTKEITLMKCMDVKKQLEKKISVYYDDREGYTSGWKFNEWELKGVPLRVEIGPKDIEKKQVVIVRRDTGEKTIVKEKDTVDTAVRLLEEMQAHLFNKAKKFLDSNIIDVESWDEFMNVIKNKQIAKCRFCGEIECEEWIKEKSGGASSRVILLDKKGERVKTEGKCVHCDKEAKYETYFSKSY